MAKNVKERSFQILTCKTMSETELNEKYNERTSSKAPITKHVLRRLSVGNFSSPDSIDIL